MLHHPYIPLWRSPIRLRTRCFATRAFTLVELVVVLVILAAVAALVLSNVDRTTDDAERIAATATLHTLREAIIGSAAAPGLLSDMKYVPGFRSVNIRTHDLLSDLSYPTEFRTYDPVAKRGWRGPYLRNTQGAANRNPSRNGRFPSSDDRRFENDATFLQRGFYFDATTSPYGVMGDLTAADPWGNPIVLQVPPTTVFSNTPDDAMRFRYARLVSAGADGILTTPLDRLAGMQFDGSKDIRGDDLVLFLIRADVYETE